LLLLLALRPEQSLVALALLLLEQLELAVEALELPEVQLR